MSDAPLTEPPHSLDPEDWAAMRAFGRRMLDDMFDHLETLSSGPCWRPMPDAVRARLRASPLPLEPAPLEAARASVLEDILPYAGGNLHPGFMGWVQGAGTPVGMIAEMVAGGLNANVGGRDHAAVEVERQVGNWMAALFGFPETARGVFVTGASMANFIAVLAARTRALGPETRRLGLAGETRRLVAYASAAAHACVPRAMEMSGIGSGALRRIPAGPDGRIDLAALRAAVRADTAAGATPFLIVGTAGTVDTGAIDDLGALREIADAAGAWLHVDGAYGALGVLSPEIAPRLAGLEAAESIAFDFHKWGQVPYDAGFILARDGETLRTAFASPADYLSREPRGLAGGEFWPCDYGPDLSRGFRALKTWMTLKTLGLSAIGASIDRSLDLARRLAARIDAEPELERLAPVSLNIVCFRYAAAEGDLDALNRRLLADVQEAGRTAPSLTRIDGRVAIRAALFNHRTGPADVETLVDDVLAFGRAAKEMRP